MDVSIIIAHYDPGNNAECREAFQETLRRIQRQTDSLSAEVIVADDGSPENGHIHSLTREKIYSDDRQEALLRGKELADWIGDKDPVLQVVTHWLYLPKKELCLAKARLWNLATHLADSPLLVFFDDDNYMLQDSALKHCLSLLKTYELVFGQIQDNSGRFRPYSSHRVQGTTFGVHRQILEAIGGFGEWTETVSSGIDSDLWWKLFQHFQRNPELRACYTTEFQTRDSCSKRWKPFIRQFFRHRAVARQFQLQHGCKNYRSVQHNPSRNKANWIQEL